MTARIACLNHRAVAVLALRKMQREANAATAFPAPDKPTLADANQQPEFNPF
jgi:hypothetical protein